jgi:ATP-binding cassette, subfamily B, bacterial
MNTDLIHEEDYHARLDWSLWRKVLRFARPYRRWFTALAAVALLVAGCDVAVLILPGLIIDQVTGQSPAANGSQLWAYGIAYAIVMLLFVACILAFIAIAGVIATGVQYDVRDASFRKLQELSFSYFDRRPIGWLMARLTSDCNQLSQIIGWALLDIVWGTAMILGVAGAMLVLNWKLALVMLAIVPPLVAVCRYFQVRLLRTSRRIRKANSHVTAAFNEGITGVRTTKSLVREEQNLAEFQGLSTEMYIHSIRNAMYAAVFLPLVTGLCAAGVALALWLGGVQVMAGTLTLGTLVIFFNCVGQLSNPVQELARMLTMIQGAQASAERIQGLLDTEPEVKDTPQALASAGDPDERIDTLEFRDVAFAYTGGQRVLDGFNLTIRAGQTIALVGPTGGGKSTIAALLCRFYEPTAGHILIDGVDYRHRPLHWLQSRLGIVLQSPFLFSGTIRENIRYGRLQASDAEVEAVARIVNAHAFIENLPEGYNSQVGEGGVKLSTGQKQLIAMARAILADPQILVMDEATSSVDTETEGLIQSAVERVLRGRTAVVIAHRLSTIRAADRILVIEGGRIVEDGAHEELLALNGRYRTLYTHQFADEETQRLLVPGLT